MRRVKKVRKKIAVIICFALICLIILFLKENFHWNVSLVPQQFTESARSLSNPNRGFYYIYGFRIRDEQVDYAAQLKEKMEKDTETQLAMIQINLQEYREGAITETGMDNIRSLFTALEDIDKQLIVRFLYDWNGENELYEPENIEIILNHMDQMEEVLRAHEKKIFVLQGLFIGNWGEMNGTRYTDTASMQQLAQKLLEVTDSSTFLAVRMPAQWRKITQISDPSEETLNGQIFADRLSLYNDGMLGNEGDYGTYGTENEAVAGAFSSWTRVEEIAFQKALCSYVPNGGEVINDNSYNDFENAVIDLADMHITYINRDYDQKVLNKWAKTRVSTADIFDGMDGLSYIERHLGYRFVITENNMEHDFWHDVVSADVVMKNVGFAPVYKDCRAVAVLYDEAGNELYTSEIPHNIAGLSGGNSLDELEVLHIELPLQQLKEGQYELYLYLEDVSTGKHIAFAVEQAESARGYQLGTIEIKN